MLLKLIKTREFISGVHCEVWEVNPVLGDRLLAEVFVLNEHFPLELIYRLTVTRVGICFAGRQCGWRRVRQQDCDDDTATLNRRSNLCLRSPHSKQPSASVYSGDPGDVEDITAYLREVQRTGEEIRIEVCRPKPELPGYPEVDYHPDDFPVVLIDDLDKDEVPEEPIYEMEDPEIEPHYR